MYEDSAVELEAFEPGGRIFSIASAGCTSFDLAARGDDVTAVDINPAQVAYVRRRLAGEATERGRIDRRFDRMRQIAPALGWTRATLERCDLDETGEQLEFWRRRPRHPPAAARARGFLQPEAASADLRPAVRRRPPASIRSHPPPPARARIRSPERRKPVRIGTPARPHSGHHACAACRGDGRPAIDFLEACAPGSFDGIALSNILDGADSEYSARLFDAVRRAASPGPS